MKTTLAIILSIVGLWLLDNQLYTHYYPVTKVQGNTIIINRKGKHYKFYYPNNKHQVGDSIRFHLDYDWTYRYMPTEIQVHH